MKITNNPNIQKILGAYKNRMTKLEKPNKVSMGKDKVEISERAKDYQIAMNAFKNLPDVREDKVEEIRKAIKSGTYNPSAEEIADKILEGVNFDKKI